jgi:drug/metabolite transporter (DMT)-like permease
MKNLNNYGILFIATLIWSLAPSLVKYVLGSLDPFPFLFLRYLVIAIACSPFLYLILKKHKYNNYDKMNIIIYSLLGQTSLIFFFVGMKYTSAVDSIIIALSAPLITIAAGHYFYKEKLSIFKEVGIILATFGTLLVIVEPAFTNHSNLSANDRIFGNLMILLYQATFSLWLVYSKFLFGKNSVFLIKIFKFFKVNLHKKPYSPYEVNFIAYYIGFVTFIPLIFFDLNKYYTQVVNLNNLEIGAIIYMGLLSSVVAYYLYSKAQSKLSMTDVSIFSYISPLFAIPAAYFILQETPSYFSFIGISIILLGLYVAGRSKK